MITTKNGRKATAMTTMKTNIKCCPYSKGDKAMFEKRMKRDANGFYNVEVRELPLMG